MADKKVTALDALTSPNKADLLMVVDDAAGTPTSKKITLEDTLDVVTGLTEMTSPDKSDELVVINDPSGTPASQKITLENALDVINGLTENSAPVNADEFVMIDDPSGTPASKKVTLANVIANVTLDSFTTASAPTGRGTGAIGYCTDGATGSAIMVYYDGSSWKRVDTAGNIATA